MSDGRISTNNVDSYDPGVGDGCGVLSDTDLAIPQLCCTLSLCVMAV
jgi:hypothetical protein